MITVSSAESGQAGSRYVLNCNIYLPTGVTVSDVPIVQWRRPSATGNVVPGGVSGGGSVYMSQLILDPLTLADGGDYTCTATYTLGGQVSPSGTGTYNLSVISKLVRLILHNLKMFLQPINMHTVPQPSVTLQLRDTTDAMVYVGRYITLECDIQLIEAITTQEVNVAVVWTKETLKITNSTRRRIMTVDGSSGVQSTLSFRPIVSTDSGQYRCTATLTSRRGTSTSEITTYQNNELNVHGMYV